MSNVKMNVNGVEFWCSAKQANAIDTLLQTNKGGFARVHGYVAKSDRVEPETYDASFLSRFSLEKLYLRKIAALEALKLDDIREAIAKDSKLSVLSDAELQVALDARKAMEIASMTKTLDGVREDARRQSHDRNYLPLGAGVKVHFLTEKSAVDGLTYPVLRDGLPQVKNVMVSAIEVSRKVIKEGVYKTTNSGVPVRISHAMQSALPKSTKLKMLSLGDENFESLVIDGEAILPKDIAGDFSND
jgi:hypothetical protein